ncbi:MULTISPECIES: TlpA disulfide reductase family protein [unclassified Shewanella]|uniref:TlpA family protein disulfide reductase n=1 Tax=unclassified Shewanella TaxID=196818 RepID=UPI001602F83E|nr:TlpA family protein disulfide reductase [Shewanella sp. SR43-8]MBB1391596.1 TlpA family protein disulfide reductase [Shewanella sp. SG44-6]|tara:strand:+ start:141 stop:680 length:540 start_codon:yes stop_codon:yes gene_type:complete
MVIASGVNAYPGMQAAAEQTTDSTLERINILPQPFPVALVDFSDIVGEPVNFDQYKGKVVVINLWATWCPPCVRELPALNRLDQTLDAAHFALLPISIDAEAVAIVQPFLESLGLPTFNSYFDPQQRLRDVFPLDTIPATFILNEQGDLVAYVRSYVDWDDKNVISFLEQFRKGTKKVQ